MSAAPKTHRWAVLLAIALPGLGNAQLGGEGLPDLSGISGSIAGAVAPKPAGTFSSGLKVPSVNPGAAAKGIGRTLRTSIEAKTGQKNPGLQTLEDEMPQTLAKIESGLQGIGFAKRDFGVAVGYFFVTTYEAATGKTVPQSASEAAGRTVAKAVGQSWAARFKAMSPANQESAYETMLVAPTLLSALATQFEKMGKTADAQAMRQASAALFEKIVGTPASSVTIDASGRIGGLAGGAASGGGTVRTTVRRRPNRPADPVLPMGKLTPSSLGGAQVFVMYVVSINGSSPINELVLFPDGTAIDDLPSKPTAGFDVATVRAASRPPNVGRWSRSGNRLTVKIGRSTDVYVKDPSGGWADPERKSGSFGIYFPVKPASPAALAGSWHNETLSSVGLVGGGGPVTFGGSSGDLVFSSNGAYVKSGRGFASTTSSVGDVSVLGKGRRAQGQWRLDGLLLTTVENGQRGVQLAYILPHWGKSTEAPEIMIQGSRWSRPGK